MVGEWKSEVKDMSFERYDKMEKKGSQTFKFLDEGNVVEARVTGYKEDSVVFVIEQDGTKKELWMSKMHPVLRELSGKGNLKGHNATMSFMGKGLEMRITLEKFQ
jgi:hypothetical protein